MEVGRDDESRDQDDNEAAYGAALQEKRRKEIKEARKLYHRQMRQERERGK